MALRGVTRSSFVAPNQYAKHASEWTPSAETGEDDAAQGRAITQDPSPHPSFDNSQSDPRGMLPAQGLEEAMALQAEALQEAQAARMAAEVLQVFIGPHLPPGVNALNFVSP